jgi:hypothetical protein
VHPDPRLPTRLGVETREQIAPGIARSMDKLIKHLPRPNRTVEIVEDCSRSVLLHPCKTAVGLNIGPTVDWCSEAKTGDAKVRKVYTELSSLDIKAMSPTAPIIMLRHDPLPSESDGTHPSRAARRVLSSEKDSSGPKVLSDRTLFCLDRREGLGDFLGTVRVKLVEAQTLVAPL